MNHRLPLSIRTLQWSVNIIIALLGAAHLYAAFFPSVSNWGVHHLAFGSGPAKFLVPGLMFLFAVPRIQSGSLRALRLAIGWYISLPRSRRRSVMAGMYALAACSLYAFRSSGILGDGLYLINYYRVITGPADIANVFIHEPLTGLIHWLVALNLIGGVSEASAEMSYRMVSIACGIAFLPLLAALVRKSIPGRTDQVLSFLFILVSGSSLLFFGYVENYSIAFLCLLLFLHAGIGYLRGETSLVVPSAIMGILIPLYFGMIVFLPVLGYLILREYLVTRRFTLPILSAVAFLAVCSGLLALTGYYPDRFIAALSGGGGHTVALYGSSTGMEGYSMFSLRHMIDLANLILLISPLSIFFILALPVPRRVDAPTPDAVDRFLLAAAGAGFALIAIFRCEIGMPRDWDLLAPFMLGVIVLAIRRLRRSVPRADQRRTIMFAAVALTSLHLIPWISFNNDSGRGVAQFQMILNQSTWIRNIHTGYEGLALFAKREGDYQTAAGIYREYLAKDSTHARILGNLADVYRVLGMEDSEMVYSEKAVRWNSAAAPIYFNLGVIYAKRSRFAEAIVVMREGLRLDPRRPDVLNSVGSFILRDGGDCPAAMSYFSEALRIDPSYALAHLNAGECYASLGDTASMRYHFLRYLQLDPAGAQRRNIQRRLNPSL